MEAMKWDLSQIVESTDPEKIKAQLKAMVEDSAAFAKRYRGKVTRLSASRLKKLLEEKDSLSLRYEGAATFCSLSFAANQSDPVASDLYHAYSNASTASGQHMAFLSIELGRLLSKHPEMVNDPTLADYRHYLERKLRSAPYLLSEEEERIIMAKDQTGVDAWSKLQSKWLSSRQFRMMVKGIEKVLSMGEIVPYIYSPDREIRKAAYHAMDSTLEVDQLLWSDALRTIWTDHLQMCKLRKYPSPLTSSLIANDVEEEAIRALMSVVEKNAPLVQRFFRYKAKLLGLNILGNWDLRAPLPDAPEGSWTWEQARDVMVSTYSDFNPKYGEWVKEMYEKRHIDGELRKGKRTGAFCDTWVAGRSAYILLSFNGKLNDLFTSAHELGHGVHAYLYTRAQNPSNCNVSLCIAECGSLFGELLLTDRLQSEAKTKDEKRAILVKVMNGYAHVVYQEGFRYFFEMDVAKAVEQGRYLDGNAISEMWMAAQKRLYGDAVEYLPETKWDWARFPHHYFSDVRFYEYPYVFAQMFVYALYRLYKEQGSTFGPRFEALLAAGSSRSAAELAAGMGFNINEEAFWQKGMDQVEEFMDQLEALDR
ncbi:MAG: M3 family oligoendopeptidase [Candidatus Saccharibacteria bacterium]